MNRPLPACPLWLLPLLLHLALLHSPVAAAEEAEAFPYTAVVTTDDVYVRSGPGKNYYPTSKLHGGEQVEVYRHDPGGWFAIRPPQDSFSWVPAKLLQLRDDKLAEVLEDQAPAHVGSLFSDVRDVHQVRLKKGEMVEVLGQKRFVDQQAGVTETWHQIAPPAGEFRWIYGTLLSRDPPRPTAVEREARVQIPLGKQETDNDARTERKRLIARQFGIEVEPAADEPPADSMQVVLLEDADEDSAVEVRLAGTTEPSDNQAAPIAVAVEAEDTVEQVGWRVPGDFREQNKPASPPAGQASEATATVARVVAPAVPRVEVPATDISIDDQLEAINADLSKMVAEEPTVWHFDLLQAQLDEVLKGADTALQRGRARRLADEIAEYEQIRQRYAEIATIQSSTDQVNSQLEQRLGGDGGPSIRPVRFETSVETGEQPVRIPRPLETIDPGQFDGAGRLAPVKSRLTGAPPYALIDAAGEVLLFVSPQPGVQLEDYLGKQVGINGRRGFMPELKMPHVTAQRVKLLE